MKEKQAPELVPQPNGKGALYSGGVPGNKGGGRPASSIRARAGALYDEILGDFEKARAEHLKALNGDKDARMLSVGELAKIADQVKTIGLGEIKSVSLDNDAVFDLLGQWVEMFWQDHRGDEFTPENGAEFYDSFAKHCQDV